MYDENGVNITNFRPEYWHTDHLGNVRLAFSDVNNNGRIEIEDDPGTPEDDTEIMQENHYYPFGMNQLGPWYEVAAPENKYQYNGKELNEELGLDWYDYGARWYDAAVGRFVGQDRFAEEHYTLTPYQYAANNPILYIDVNGDSISVAEQYREQFQADLQATFGDKASSFTFNKSGKVIFTGNAKDFKGKERKALKGLQEVLKEKITTNVIYEDQIEIAGQTIHAAGEAGALSILASENPGLLTENIVLISPNNTPTELNYIEFSEGFPQKTVDNNRATSLFHELGHIIHAGQDQSKVIQFDNTIRSIQKAPNPDGTFRKNPLKKRTPDITHNRASQGVITGGN
jgi:RHS repeat-associated protein